MKDCGITKIDNERKVLVDYANEIIHDTLNSTKENAEDVINKIVNFRMKLAYDRGTETLEGTFGWTSAFDELIKELESIKSRLSN